MTPQLPNVFTLHIQELRQDSNIYSVQVRWFTKIKDVKDLLHSITNIAPSRQQLFQSNSSVPLSSSLTMHDLKISKSGQSLRLSVIDGSVLDAPDFVLNRAGDSLLDEECTRILTDVRFGLQRHNVPIKTDVLDCTGGVYFMRAVSGRKLAVFKPQDEEQGMPNNTKGYEGSGELGLRKYYKPGYGCMREVAAYLMDVNNFCSVPATSLVHFEHPILNYPGRGGRTGHPFPKFGSLQKFVHAFDSFEDVGISVLSDLEVQKIALLDLRLLNCDRNASNILAIHKDSYGDESVHSKGNKYCADEEFDLCFDDAAPTRLEGSSSSDLYALVPIDHGYCLPSKLLINEIDWSWFYCPQVNRPVHEDIKKYVKELDIDAILKNVLSQVELSEDSQFLSRISHQLVVEGINAGLNLFEIAIIVARISDDDPSPLEKAIEEAEENAHRTIEMRIGTISRSGKIKEKEKEKDSDRIYWKSTEKILGSDSAKGHRKRVNEHENAAICLSSEKYTHNAAANWTSLRPAKNVRTVSEDIRSVDRESAKTDSSAMSSRVSLEDQTSSFTDSSEVKYTAHAAGSWTDNHTTQEIEMLNCSDNERILQTLDNCPITPSSCHSAINRCDSEKGNARGPASNGRVAFGGAHYVTYDRSVPLFAPLSLPSTPIAPPVTVSIMKSPRQPISPSTPILNTASVAALNVSPSSTSALLPTRPLSLKSLPIATIPIPSPLVILPLTTPPIFPPTPTSALITPSPLSTATTSTFPTPSPSGPSTPQSIHGPLTAPKTMSYARALAHGEPLHSIQSEDGSIRSTQGTALRRMNAINPQANGLDERFSTPFITHTNLTQHPYQDQSAVLPSPPLAPPVSPPLSLPSNTPTLRLRTSIKEENENGNSSNYDTTDSDAPSEIAAAGLSDADNDDNDTQVPVLTLKDPRIEIEKVGLTALKDPKSTYCTPDRTLSTNFKKLNLSPTRRPYHLNQVGSADHLRKGRPMEGDGYYANGDDDLGGTDSDDSPQSSPLAMSAMIRVTSFSAFSSAPIYDAEGAERRMGKLRKERRRLVALTDEFRRLRLLFARNSIATLISKALKRKHSTSF